MPSWLTLRPALLVIVLSATWSRWPAQDGDNRQLLARATPLPHEGEISSQERGEPAELERRANQGRVFGPHTATSESPLVRVDSALAVANSMDEIEVGDEFYLYAPSVYELAMELSSPAAEHAGHATTQPSYLGDNLSSIPANRLDTGSGKRDDLTTREQLAQGREANSSQASTKDSSLASNSGSSSSIPANLAPAATPTLTTPLVASQQPANQRQLDRMAGQEDQRQIMSTRLDLNEGPYCLGHKDSELSFNWLCQGLMLVKVPVSLVPKPMSLRLSNTGIEMLTDESLSSYRETLRDFSVENAPKLARIAPGTFEALACLRVLYIFQAPRLARLDLLIGNQSELVIVRVQQTSLRNWPFMSFKQDRVLTSIDLDNNKIATLGSQPLNIRTELLNLEFNQIYSIEEHTFNGSEIAVLSLSGNRKLKYIHGNAFENLRNLIKLDLSSTGLTQLPSVGLDQLRELIIRDTYALKRIPSIYSFPRLREAHLTYAYHCCSFRYPREHDPSAYEQHLADWTTKCAGRRQELADSNTEDFEGDFNAAPNTSWQSPAHEPVEPPLPSSSSPPSSAAASSSWSPSVSPPPQSAQQQPEGRRDRRDVDSAADESSPAAPALEPSKAGRPAYRSGSPECHELKAQLSSRLNNISCTPEPDAFNPCEDIMGYPVLRVAVWFVVGASVFGNLSVIVVLANIFKRLSVPKFLQLNLAIGDLFMGVYLALLALADLNTLGSYFNYAIDWQHGYGCKLAGAASLFASQLSIFTLSVITFERYYTITYSIDLNMRLQLGWAARIMFLGWLYAFASAMLPIFADINSYSKTSICLPMRTKNITDRLFILVLLVIDSSAFVIIFACYLKMYLLILRQKTEATAKERTVAMRMALFVSTDFACWAPIIFFGTTALFGKPLISVTNSKILIVFFYPLNSMANPFLYVISTRQYRRDLNYLSSRWSMWRKSLFRKNNPCNYPSNNAHGAVNANQALPAAGSLHVQLGAVAAVTGVARHLHRNQFSESALDKAALAEALGAEFVPALELVPQNLPESVNNERFVHTKTKSSGFVLRHQIITGNGPRHAETSRPRRTPNMAAVRQAQLRAQRRNQPDGRAQAAEVQPEARPADSAALDETEPDGSPMGKRALVAPTVALQPPEVDGDQPHALRGVELANQPSRQPERSRRRRCCRYCCKCRRIEQARTCDKCNQRRGYSTSRKPLDTCTAPKNTCIPELMRQRCATASPADALQPISRLSELAKRQRRSKADEGAPIDILGNLSNNDPNSSVSAISSPPASQSGEPQSQISADKLARLAEGSSLSKSNDRRGRHHSKRATDLNLPLGVQVCVKLCDSPCEPTLQLERRARRVQCKRCREVAAQSQSDNSPATRGHETVMNRASQSKESKPSDALSVQAGSNDHNDVGDSSAQKEPIHSAP